jgi:hypothetical protein
MSNFLELFRGINEYLDIAPLDGGIKVFQNSFKPVEIAPGVLPDQNKIDVALSTLPAGCKGAEKERLIHAVLL